MRNKLFLNLNNYILIIKFCSIYLYQLENIYYSNLSNYNTKKLIHILQLSRIINKCIFIKNYKTHELIC